MFIWLVLGLIVVMAAFVIAMRSMADFLEKPDLLRGDYGLFFIQRPSGLNTPLVNEIYNQSVNGRLILSFERLYRLGKTAHLIYGPRAVLKTVQEPLLLLEIEDYTQAGWDRGVSVAEFTVNPANDVDKKLATLLQETPALSEDEAVWWQLVVKPVSGTKPLFYTLLRLVVISKDQDKALWVRLSKKAVAAGFTPLLSTSSGKRRDFYQARSLPLGRLNTSLLSVRGVQVLVGG